MDYRIQRLKEDLTNAQQRNKKQRIQLANYKKVHERDLETIKKYKKVIDEAIEYIKHYETIRGYYEYEECGYDEYNYEEDLKEELLNILKESGEIK